MSIPTSVASALLLSLSALVCVDPAAANTVEYVHTDALGSVVAVTDANRNIVERREYEPYGHQLTPALQNGPGYTGHVQDAATGMTYMQQRYYDPVLGRFLSADPVTVYGNSGGNFNRYWYANNNPYAFIDPDGREVRRYNCGASYASCGASGPNTEPERKKPVEDMTVPRRGSPRGYADGRFSMEGSYRRYPDGSPKRHTGTDVMGPPGSEVRASAAGKVARVGEVTGFGSKTVIVETQSANGARYQVLYGHLLSNTVKAGDTVAQGQTIGVVGSDGLAGGVPHLHMDVAIGTWSRDAARADPEQWLKDSPTTTVDIDFSKP